jgi:ABC-type multidrug transport system fused ATPase/permease subunit
VVGRVLKSFVDRSPKLHSEILDKLQDAAVRERAAKVAREFDVKEFAARVRGNAEEHPEAAKQIMRILGGPEATAFFTEMQTDLQEKVRDRYRKPLEELEATGRKRWEELTRQARIAFYLNMGMSVALFLVGTGIIVWGLWILTTADDLVQQIGGGLLSAVAALATTYSGRFWKDPVEHIQGFSAQQARLQAAFIGYMNRIGQASLVFEQDFAEDSVTLDDLERYQRLLDEAVDQASKQLSIE